MSLKLFLIFLACYLASVASAIHVVKDGQDSHGLAPNIRHRRLVEEWPVTHDFELLGGARLAGMDKKRFAYQLYPFPVLGEDWGYEIRINPDN